MKQLLRTLLEKALNASPDGPPVRALEPTVLSRSSIEIVQRWLGTSKRPTLEERGMILAELVYAGFGKTAPLEPLAESMIVDADRELELGLSTRAGSTLP
jgi:hypothetical protein